MKNNIIYIGVSAIKSGKRSGKDTFAIELMLSLNKNIKNFNGKIVSLADALKNACSVIYGFDLKKAYGTEEEKEEKTNWDWPEKNVYGYSGKMTIRNILQYVGTELFRENFDKNIWVKSLIANCEKERLILENENKLKPEDISFVIIPDIRFKEEVEFLDYLIDIDRTNVRKIGKDSHASELEGLNIPKEKINLTIYNWHDINSLRKAADDFVERWIIDKKTGTFKLDKAIGYEFTKDYLMLSNLFYNKEVVNV
jgi:hypothetical protein